MSTANNGLDAALEKVGSGFAWLRDLVLGEFAEDRPLSVVIADMLLSFVPGVVIVLSARDIAAVCLRLGKRYNGTANTSRPQPPEWQEWVLLIACLITLIAPVIGAVVGSAGTVVGTAVGAVVGQEASAFLRALCLLLIRDSQVILKTLLEFLGTFTRGNVHQMLRAIKFTAYEKPLLEYLNTFLTKTLDAVRKLRSYLNRWPFNQATQLLARLQEIEKEFYAVQLHAVREIPRALAELDARLAKALEQAVKEPSQVATAGVHAEKPVPMAMNGGRITSGVGMRPLYLERPPGTSGTPVPIAPPPVPHGPNVHAFDPKTANTAQKGIYGEVISDQYMLGKGHENLLSSSRGPRSMDMKPTGRGIDGVYKNANPPPPYIITEAKYRTGGEFSASSLPTTKGSGKQMSDRWIRPRLIDVLGNKGAGEVHEAGYERWLMVVNENGDVKNIVRLDQNAKTIDSSTP